MYIIHTADPETVSSEKSAQNSDKDEPDSAPGSSSTLLLLFASVLLTLDLRLRLF